MKKIKELKRIKLLFLLPIALLLILICKWIPCISEYLFARGIYKMITVPIGAVSSIFPFSIAEILAVMSLPSAVIIMVLFIRNIIKSKGERKYVLMKGILNILCFISTAVFLFVIMCGTNYYRYEFEYFMPYDIREYSEDELKELCYYLKDRVEEEKNNIIKEHPEFISETKAVVYTKEFCEFADDCDKTMEELAKKHNALKFSGGTVKNVYFSRYMSYGGIVGIYIPFTVESNVNTDVADYNHPADALHELAHMRGFMREDEANFISYLACRDSNDSYFRYSGYMLAFIHATNALYDYDADEYFEIFDSLSDEVCADLNYENKYWDELKEDEIAQQVEDVVTKVNDTYLKINGEEDGVRSYGMMVDLLIADYLYSNGN